MNLSKKNTLISLIILTTIPTLLLLKRPVSNTAQTIKENPLLIEALNGRQEIAAALVAMQINEWKTEQLRSNLEHDRSQENKLPSTFIAWYNGQLAGSCCLEETNFIEPTLTPWASHLYIKPEFRGKKIAKKLILCIAKKARELGYETFFYVTNKPNNTAIYKHLGGTIVKKMSYQNEKCTIMEGRLEDFNY